MSGKKFQVIDSNYYSHFSDEELDFHQKAIAVEFERRGIRQFDSYVLVKITSAGEYRGVALCAVLPNSNTWLKLREWRSLNPDFDTEEGRRFVQEMIGDFTWEEAILDVS